MYLIENFNSDIRKFRNRRIINSNNLVLIKLKVLLQKVINKLYEEFNKCNLSLILTTYEVNHLYLLIIYSYP